MSDSDKNRPSWVDENIPPELAGSTLFKFNITLPSKDENGKSQSIDVSMLPDLDLDYEILETQMESIPAQYAFWAAVYSEVKFMVTAAERQLKIRRGEATKIVQEEAANKNVKLSVDQVKNIVEADQQLVKNDLAFNKYQMVAGKLYHMVEAIRIKADLARSLAGFKRQENDKTT